MVSRGLREQDVASALDAHADRASVLRTCALVRVALVHVDADDALPRRTLAAIEAWSRWRATDVLRAAHQALVASLWARRRSAAACAACAAVDAAARGVVGESRLTLETIDHAVRATACAVYALRARRLGGVARCARHEALRRMLAIAGGDDR